MALGHPAALTTVRQPLMEMGATAATMVVSMAEGEPFQRRVELGTELVVQGKHGPRSGVTETRPRFHGVNRGSRRGRALSRAWEAVSRA